MTNDCSSPEIPWRTLFRRFARQSLLDTQHWCLDKGLDADAWLSARWTDEDGRCWSALSRLGFEWLLNPSLSATSASAFSRALMHAMNDSKKAWPETHSGEPDIVWAWLGVVASGEVLAYGLIRSAFNTAPRLPDGRAACGLGDGPGWMAQALAQATWAAKQAPRNDIQACIGFDRLMESWLAGGLWITHEEPIHSPWLLGFQPAPIPERAREPFEEGPLPKELKDRTAYSGMWTKLAQLYEVLANRGLLYNASLLPEFQLPQLFLRGLTPAAQQQGWAVVKAALTPAHANNFLPQVVVLADALALAGSRPQGWEAKHWKGVQEGLRQVGVPLNFSPLLREAVLMNDLPSSAPASPSRPRF